jgi:hypothetical protein
VWACINGDKESAIKGFNDMLSAGTPEKRKRAGTFDLSPEAISRLAENPLPMNCQSAVFQLFEKLEP